MKEGSFRQFPWPFKVSCPRVLWEIVYCFVKEMLPSGVKSYRGKTVTIWFDFDVVCKGFATHRRLQPNDVLKAGGSNGEFKSHGTELRVGGVFVYGHVNSLYAVL